MISARSTTTSYLVSIVVRSLPSQAMKCRVLLALTTSKRQVKRFSHVRDISLVYQIWRKLNSLCPFVPTLRSLCNSAAPQLVRNVVRTLPSQAIKCNEQLALTTSKRQIKRFSHVQDISPIYQIWRKPNSLCPFVPTPRSLCNSSVPHLVRM